MIVAVKKKTILSVAFVILICVCTGLLFVPALSIGADAGNGKTIVIDAGHGGIDGGVVGVNTGTKESDINLTVARKLKNYLVQGGYDVIMTRVNSDGLYGLAAKNKKRKDMETRKEKILAAAPDLVVSIHQNYYPRADVRGAQVFYAAGSETSQRIAGVMQGYLNTGLEASSRTEAVGDYYILQCTEFPSVLVECGFLSNPADEKLLVSAAYQDRIAYTIFTGIHSVMSESQDTCGGVYRE